MKNIIQLTICLLIVWAAQIATATEIEHWQTTNGGRVYFMSTPSLPIVDIRIVFDAGSARDSGKSGLAALTNGLLAEGAAGMNADQIAEQFADAGARFSNSSLKDMSIFSLRSLRDAKYLEPALKTFIQVISQPDFPDEAVERVRRQMLSVIEFQKQSPGNIANEAFYKTLYADHPYGTPSIGTAETVSALAHEELKTFYSTYYVASNAVIAIVADLDKAAAEKLAEQLTMSLQTGKKASALPEPKALTEASVMNIKHPADQTHVMLGQLGMSRFDPDYFTLYVGNHILGGGGLVSILADEIREKRGLSYSVYSGFAPMRIAGPFIMGLQTKNDQAENAIKVVRETVASFIENG
ncbi:MAG: pitrilysin family protein, partial [Pseudomonadota bacterium]